MTATDPELWVRLTPGWSPDPDLHWLIFGNAHTHRGHFHVCSAEGDEHRTVNLADVAELSPEARIWLAGFLAGQEAGFEEFMGAEELADAATDADYERWREWNARFRRRGFAPRLQALPPADLDFEGIADPSPWCFVGGLYRQWLAGSWRVADQQPPPDDPAFGWTWPGSVCAQRRHCRIEVRGGYLCCSDCHHVTV